MHEPACNHPDPDAVLASARHNIDVTGWHATAVLADLDAGTPGFVYTTGIHAGLGHPELVITALPPQDAHAILASARERIACGIPLGDGELHEQIANMPLLVRDLPRRATALCFGVTDAVTGHSDIPYRQLVWPDPAGHYPGDSRCDPRMAALQDTVSSRSPWRCPGAEL